MSVGEASIGLNLNLIRLEDDVRSAERLLNRISRSVIKNSEEADKVIAGLLKNSLGETDRLQRSFNALNIKSGLQIEKEQANIVRAFEQIKRSGVASAEEIKRAHTAMQAQIAKLNGQEVASKATSGINLLSLASVAAIAKVQILYSLVNSVMSAIGSIPSTTIDAIESYNASVVTSAAMITSMQKGVKDIGVAYGENKRYAEAVEQVLIKMDAETAASAKNLRDMNAQFVQQGVLLDVNSQKQVNGFKAIANALSAITAADPNQAMQFAQEIRALRSFEDKGSNRLVQMLKAQGVTKEMFETWKASDTVLEEMGKRLQGFAAAQGDINYLWSTVKSTMETVRDEVMRGGLAPAFREIVEWMKELTAKAVENKEKIQAFLAEAFKDAKALGSVFLTIGKGIASIGEPLIWAAITTGIYGAVAAMRAFAAETTIATGGINLIIAGLATAGLYGAKKMAETRALEQRVAEIKAEATKGGWASQATKLGPGGLEQILSAFPMATNQEIIEWINRGAISFGSGSALAGNGNIYAMSMNQEMIKFLRADAAGAPVVKPTGIAFPPGGEKAAKVDKTALTSADLFAISSARSEGYNDYDPYISPKSWDDAIKKVKEMDKAMEEARKPYDELVAYLRSEEEAIRESYEKRKQVIADSTWLSTDEQAALLAKLDAKLNEQLEGLKNKNNTLWDDMKDGMKGWASQFSSSLNEAFWAADSNFSKIAESFAKMTTQIIIQRSIVQPIVGGMMGFMDSFIASANGNAFSGGRLVAYANGGVVSSPTLFPMASGAGLMGEAGPEAVMPLKRINGKLGVIAQTSSAPDMTVNVINNTGQQVRTKSQPATFDGKGYVKTVILELMDTDPSFRSGMRGY